MHKQFRTLVNKFYCNGDKINSDFSFFKLISYAQIKKESPCSEYALNKLQKMSHCKDLFFKSVSETFDATQSGI